MKLAGILLALSSLAAAATRADMLVSTDWLAQHANDANLAVLHVSANRATYDQGHVPGARFVALSSIAITRDGIPNELPPVADLKNVFQAAGVSDSSRVILYSDGSVLPATRAYFTLDYLGHGDQAALLDGGLDKWKSEGRPLTKDAPAAVQASFTPRVKADLLAQIEMVNQLATSPSGGKSATLLDVRAASNFSAAHIPNSANVYWETSIQNQSLKSEADLRKLYEAAGIAPNRQVVTYCNSGMQSSQSYFTLKYLGYDVKMYDGSMSEWTAKGAPVEK